MSSKILLKWKFLIIGVAVVAFSPTIIFLLSLVLPNQNSYIKPALSASDQAPPALVDSKPVESAPAIVLPDQKNPGLPVRLKIPKINVDAVVENVGLISNGTVMDVPKNQDNVAWLKLGQRPGENGTAVMAGHYGWINKKLSVFDNLYKLRQGDKLYVEDDQGAIVSFIVRESRKYDPDADAPVVFSSNDGNSHLNLITCGGEWDKVSKNYSKRLVVFTDKE